MIIEFTEEERRALLALIDISVKATGLQFAEAAIELAKKLQAAQHNVKSPQE
jgi:hypothetical protein